MKHTACHYCLHHPINLESHGPGEHAGQSTSILHVRVNLRPIIQDTPTLICKQSIPQTHHAHF